MDGRLFLTPRLMWCQLVTYQTMSSYFSCLGVHCVKLFAQGSCDVGWPKGSQERSCENKIQIYPAFEGGLREGGGDRLWNGGWIAAKMAPGRVSGSIICFWQLCPTVIGRFWNTLWRGEFCHGSIPHKILYSLWCVDTLSMQNKSKCLGWTLKPFTITHNNLWGLVGGWANLDLKIVTD